MTRTVQNPRLRDALQTWLHAALPLLKPRVPSLSFHDARKSYPWLLRGQLMIPGTPIHQLHETHTLFDIVSHMPEFSSHTTSDSVPHDQEDIVFNFFAKGIIADFVNLHVLDTSDWEFDTETFENLYSDLEQFLYRFADLPIKTTIELWHVKSETSPISLSPVVAIRNPTEDERIESQKATSSAPRTDPFDEDPPVPELLIEITQRGSDFVSGIGYKTSRLGRRSYKSLEIAERVLLALRLINEGAVWLGFKHTYPGNRFLEADRAQDLADPSVWSRYFSDSLWETSPNTAPHAPYVINNHVAGQLASLWPILCLPLENKKLELPLRRFRFSYDRKAVTDRLIDHWIALEALFATNEQELAYKVSQRIAQFIGTSPEERWEIFSTAKKSYDTRSRIVHGDEFKNEELLKHSIPTEDYLRRSLLKCLESQKMPSRKELEKQMFLQDVPGLSE